MIAYPNLTKRHTIAYIGTYPPKECGIATFTLDMVNATDLSGWRSLVVAVDDTKPTEKPADSKVVYTIEKENRADYRRAARLLLEMEADIVSIQHEYGIYGGDHGEYILELARAATMPVIVTLHTVLPEPSEKQRSIIKDLEKATSGFMVMAKKAVELLVDVYGVSASKITMIPHGAPNASFDAGAEAKSQFGLEGRHVISTFGLISPNKGIEDAIAAMPEIVAHDPKAIYLVLGQTHPVIKRREGEWYRDGLVKQANDLGLGDNVRFIDQYLSLQELIDYLLATDIYITPYYANPHQITSGTLAYAVALGKAVVSTPYLYAEELLADGRGFLYPFRDTKVLADQVSRLLTDPELFEATRRKAFAYGRSMTWQSVGLQYTRLCTSVLNERWVNHRAAMDTLSLPGLSELRKAGDVWAPPPVTT